MNNKIGILDYGCGNLRSIMNAFHAVNADSWIIQEPEEVYQCTKLVLPGVGAFQTAMSKLRERKLDAALDEYVKSGKYLLGICLGMQLMCLSSQEHGNHPGLGWINADVLPLAEDLNLKVPHMGWNELNFKKEHPCIQGIAQNSDVYFVHSYYVKNHDTDDIVATTQYGFDFSSIFAKDNLIGMQFHPEKSQDVGLHIFRCFSNAEK